MSKKDAIWGIYLFDYLCISFMPETMNSLFSQLVLYGLLDYVNVSNRLAYHYTCPRFAFSLNFLKNRVGPWFISYYSCSLVYHIFLPIRRDDCYLPLVILANQLSFFVDAHRASQTNDISFIEFDVCRISDKDAAYRIGSLLQVVLQLEELVVVC